MGETEKGGVDFKIGGWDPSVLLYWGLKKISCRALPGERLCLRELGVGRNYALSGYTSPSLNKWNEKFTFLTKFRSDALFACTPIVWGSSEMVWVDLPYLANIMLEPINHFFIPRITLTGRLYHIFSYTHPLSSQSFEALYPLSYLTFTPAIKLFLPRSSP